MESTKYVGNLSTVSTNHNLSGFTIDFGNFTFIQHTIPEFTSAQTNFITNHSNNSIYFNESITYSYDWNKVYQIINTTSNWENEINVTVTKYLPINCEFENITSSNLEIPYTYDNPTRILTYTYKQNYSKEITISCLANYGDIVIFSPNNYTVNTSEIFAEPITFLNLKSYIVAQKHKREDSFTWENGYLWDIHFKVYNEDEIDLNISKIHVWASNSTTDYSGWSPDKNYLYDANVTCVDNILSLNEYCEHNDTFASMQTPVVWADVDYNVDFNISKKGSYLKEMDSSSSSIVGLYVGLITPNNTIIDTEVSNNFEFIVTANANCTLYGNFSGVWASNETVNNVVGSSQISTTGINSGTYIWNVRCINFSNGAIFDRANSNNTITANGKPRFNGPIPDLVWSEDTIDQTLNLSDYFTDPEGEDINWTFEPNPVNNINVQVYNDTGNVTLIPNLNFFGLRTITFYGFDSLGRNVSSNLILLNVTQDWDPPVIEYWEVFNQTDSKNSTGGDTNITGSEGNNIIFNVTASDPDNTLLNLFWFLNKGLGWVLQQSDIGVLDSIWTFITDLFDAGDYKVKLVVNSSEDSYNATQEWNVTINNVNRAPPTPTLIWPTNISTVEQFGLCLNWSNVTDPDDPIYGGTSEDKYNVTYYIFHSDNSNPVYLNKTNESYYCITSQTFEKTYYWYIIAGDEEDNATRSEMWQYYYKEPQMSAEKNRVFYEDATPINLTINARATGLTLTTDFSCMDSGYSPGDETVTEHGSGMYSIYYWITAGNTRANTRCEVNISANDGRYYLMNLSLKNGYWEAFYVGRANDCAGGLPTSNYFEEGGMCPTIPYKVDTSFAFGKFAGFSAEKLCNNGAADEYDPSGASATDTDGGDCADYDCASIVYGEPIGAKAARDSWTCADGTNGWRDDPPWESSGFVCYDSLNLCSGGSGSSPTGTTNWIYTKVVKPGGYFAIRFHQDNLASDPDVSGGLYLNVNSFDEDLSISNANFFVINRSTYFGGANSGLLPKEGLVTTSSMIRAQTDDGSGTMTDYTGDDLDIIFRLYIPPTTTVSGLQQIKVARYFPTAASKDYGIEFTIDASGMDSEDDISCSDDEDNDLDYMYDCRDIDCENKTGNSADVNDLCRFGNESKYASITNDCMDGFDNDRDDPSDSDGAKDCRFMGYDTDCNGITILDSSWDSYDISGIYGGSTTGVCELTKELNCSDNFDNDRDRAYDCYVKEIRTGFDYDASIDYNTNPTNPLCTVSNQNSLNTNDHPDAEYNCASYCQSNNFATESEVGLKGCLDGKDNDLDFYNIGTCNQNASAGVDCRMVEYDPDCNGKPMQESDGDTGNCELVYELTCNDDVDNDRDGVTDCAVFDAGADGIPSYQFNSDMDGDYDCSGKCSNTEENTGVECRDNIDNDLDYWTITGWSSNQYTATNNGAAGGLDCRYNYDGNHYPDSDCDGVTVNDLSSNSGDCELGNELTCNDGMDNDIDENTNKGGDRRANVNGADCDDYDCGGNAACPSSEGSLGGSCLDGIDNDLDRYNWGHTAYQLDANRGTNTSGGIDCIYNYDGIRPSSLGYLSVAYDNYLADPDCDNTIIGGSGELCELYEENNCTDNFDNDQDQYIATSSIHRSGWAGNLDLTRGTTYNIAADCDDYSCQGKTGCPTNEDGSLCLVGNCGDTRNWCLDGIDNDLDDYDFKGYTIDNTVGKGIDCAWNNWDSDCNGALFNDTYGNNLVGTCEIRTEITCNDGVDNDQDRAIFKLGGSEVGSETAGYGTGIDCDDYDCSGNAACPIKENASTCGDGIDNDLDMFYWDGSSYQRNSSTGADCADPDCQGLPGPGGMLCAQAEAGDLICGDYDGSFFSQDNDGNGPANCYDGGCYKKGSCRICPAQENFSIDSCADGLDNELTYTWIGLEELLYKAGNLNGSIVTDGTDCGDADCSGYFDGTRICGATESSCNDGLDNDRDGDIDCDDSECSGNAACPSYPTNTITSCAAGTDCTKDGYIRSLTQNLPRLTTVNNFGSTTTRFIYSRHVRVGANASFRFTNTNQALIAGKPANMLVGTSGAGNNIPDAWAVTEAQSYDVGTDDTLYTPVKVSTGVQLAYTPYPAATNLDMTLYTTINHSDAAASPLSYSFSVAHDIGGEMNTGTGITVYVYEDEPPNVTWAYPPEDYIFRRIRTSDTLHVRANAFDNDPSHTFNSGIDYCQFYNGVSWVNEDSISSTSKGNCRHELSISDGASISIGARAYDGVDNLGDEQYRNISVRTIPRQTSDFQCLDGVNCSWDYPARKWYNRTETLPILIRFTSDVEGFSTDPNGCQVFFATDDTVYDLGNITLTSYSGTYGRCEGTINLSNTPIAATSSNNFGVYVKVKDNAGEVGYSGIEPYRDIYAMNDIWICNWVNTVDGKWSCLAPCDANTAPIIENIPDYNLSEDSIPPTNWTDLWNYTTDNEQWDADLTYTLVNQTNTGLINCSLIHNRYINCSKPALDQSGSTTITVKVYDGFEEDTAEYDINILPLNDGPRLILNISNKTIIEDTTDATTDLNNHFMDVEGDEINWTVNSSLSNINNLTVTIDNSTGILTITPDLDFIGIRWITINAIDEYGAFNISNNFTINITPVNDAPFFNDTINNITFAEDTYNDSINLTKYSKDVDSLDLNWSINLTQSNINNLIIQINNDTGIVNISSDLNLNGLRWIVFNVFDEELANNYSNNVTINITPVNDAPYFNDTINNITIIEDNYYNLLNLSNFTYDVDQDILNWSINPYLSNIQNLTIIINNSGIVNITPDLNFVGVRWITFNVTDPNNLFDVSNNITINITPVNDAPTFNDTINNITFKEDTYNDTIILLKHFYDVDGDDLNWSINHALSNTTNLTILIDNNTGLVNITSDLNFFGIRNIYFNAYDPDGLFATSNNVIINVTPVNDAPYFNDTINKITFAEDTIYNLLNLSNYTNDVDDLDLNWSINLTLSNIQNLSVIINNATGIVTITPDGNFTGIRNITFVVWDSFNAIDTSNLITINITAVNDRPTFNDTINNITFKEDTYNDTIILLKHFYDIDGDDLNWSINHALSNTTNLTILIDNNTGLVNITSDLNFFGIRNIYFNAYDPDGLFATSNNVTINVTPVNDAPVFNSTINNITFSEDTIYNLLDLSNFTYDVDDLDLNWTVNNSLSIITNLTININNATGIVTIIPDGNFTGIRFVTFNVYDAYGLFNTSNLITINVTPVNDAPTFNDTINNITFKEDTYNDTINLSKHFYDIDGDDLNWSINHTLSNTNNLTILIDNNTGLVNITSDLNFFGIRNIYFNAYDPDGLFATSNNVIINVTPVNDAPFFNSTINNITFNEDTIYNSLNLSLYSKDVDDLDLNWTINSSSSIQNLSIIINNATGIVTIIPDGNFTGIRYVFFNVLDGKGLINHSNNITINVTPVNDAPTFNDTINNITFKEDTYNDTINLSKHFYDIDGDDLNWSINHTLSNTNNLTILIDNNTGLVNITSDLNFFGIRNIYFNAYDPDGLFATSNNVIINVTLVNDAPFFNSTINNITFNEDTIYNSLNISIYSDDVDDLDLNWTVNNSLSIITNLTININNATGIVTIIPDGNFTGIRFVTFNVYDAYGLFNTSNLITINVTPVNDAPTFNDTINNITFKEDTYNDTINLSKHFYDIDGDDLNWSVNTTLSNTNNLIIQINNNTGDVNISSDPNFYGVRNLYFNAYDPDGLFATSNSVIINITPVNDAPVISTLPNITFLEDTYNDTLIFNPYVFDVDNLDSELNWTYQNLTGSNVIVNINNTTKQVNFTSPFNWYGSELIEFTVHDPVGLTDSFIINVTVISVNDAPIINPVIPNITLFEDFGIYSFNLTPYETDDNDVLQGINWSISGVNVALFTALINTTTDNLTLYSQSNANGIDEVLLTLTDNGGLIDTQLINITILPVNDAPNSFNLISPINGFNTSDNTTFFDWQTTFDIDGDDLTYYLEIDDSFNFDTLNRRIESSVSNHTLSLANSLTDGLWYWRVEVCDNSSAANNCTYSIQNWSVRVDTNGPIIILDDPDFNQTVAWNITFYNTITDDIAIANVTYNITNSTGNVVKTGFLYDYASFDFWWDTNTLTPDGTYNITIYAEDNLGNYNINSSIFTIDNTDPSVQIVYPEFIYLNDSFSVLIDLHNEHLMNVSFNITNSTGALMYSNSSNIWPTIKDYQYTDFINVNTWNDDNYTINSYGNDEVYNDRQDSSWFVVDQTKPQFISLTRTPDPIYHTTQVTINVSYVDQFTVKEVNISHNATGFWNNITAIEVAPNIYQINISPSILENGERVGFYATAVDLAGNVNRDMLMQNFTVVNRPTTITNLEFNKPTFRIYDSLNCSAIVSDDDNDTLSLQFKMWDKSNNYFVPNYLWTNTNITCNSTDYTKNVLCYANISSISGLKGNWSCSLLVVDGFDSTLSYDINGSEMINTIPTITNPTVNNTSPNVLTTIECINGTFADDNLEDVQNKTYWNWYNNGVLVPHNQKILNLSDYWPGTFARGDNITCTEKVFDGTDNSTWANSSNFAIIVNSIPYITYINTTPYNDSLSTDDLYCNFTVFDADLDPNLAVIDWFVNNVSTGINNVTLKSTNTSDSEIWLCQVTPFDGLEYGTPMNSSTVFVVGSRPDIVSFVDNSNSTNPINVGDTLNITVDWYDLDQFGGGESVALYVCNSSSITSSGCSDRTYCSAPMSPNDPVNCSFTASQSDNTTMVYYLAVCDDSNTCSLINESTKGIFEVNHKPNFNYAKVESSINSTNSYTNDTLICNYSYYDVDSDVVSISFNWYEFNGSTWNSLGVSTQNLNPENTTKHNYYLCEITAIDEHSFDNFTNSSYNIVLNKIPTFNISELISNIRFPEDTFNDTINLSRLFFDIDDDAIYWNIDYSNSKLENVSVTYSNATGAVLITSDLNFYGVRNVTFLASDLDTNDAGWSTTNLITINITPVNDYPIFTNVLPNITFAEDTFNDSLVLSSYSFDVDGDDMNWSIDYTQSNIENLTILINNNTGLVNFSADLNFFGIRYVVFNVSDPYGLYNLSNNVTINVTPVNDAPFFNDTIPEIVFPEDTIYNSLDLTLYSDDVDDLDLNWTINPISNLQNLSVSINNATGIVTITPDNNFTGIRNIMFTVWDSFNATDNSNLILINVTPVNDRPIFTNVLPNITFAEDTFNDSLVLSSYSFDVDGDDMNWSIDYTQSNIENLTILIDNNTGLVNFSADLNFFGIRYVVFNVSDPSNTFDLSSNVTINVTPVNDAPFFNDTIPAIVFPEDTIYNSLDLTLYSDDVDDLDLNWTINPISNLQNLSANINNATGIVTITPDNNFTGIRNIMFTVWDSFNATDNSNLILINVTPVNDRPIFTNILPNITFAEDTFNDSLVLSSYSFDVDGDDMNWSIDYTQSNIENLTILIDNNTGLVNFSADLNFFGMRYVVFNVSDPSNTFDLSSNVTINVTPVNDAPFFNDTIPAIVFPEDTIYNLLDLSNYSYDVDDLDLNWTINQGMSIITNLTINIDNATGIVTIIPSGNFTGIRFVTFTVWDSFNATDNSNLILINVTPVNDPPTFRTEIINVSFFEDTFNASIVLANHFFDIDGDDLNWTINESSNIRNLSFDINNDTGLVNISADLDWYGFRWVVFNALDPSGTYAISNNVSIEVIPVNDPPRQIAPIPDIVFPEDTIFKNLNLTDYFYDVEGSYINYTIEEGISSTQNLTFTIINNTGNITIVPDGNFTNTRYVYFNAIDNESASTLSSRVNIDVTPVNDPPASLPIMPNITVWENQYNTSITLDDFVWDVDNPDWELSWGFISATGHILGSVIWNGLTQIANISGQLEWNGHEPLTLNVCDAEYCRNTTIWVLVLGKDYPVLNSYNISNRSTSWWTFNNNPVSPETENLQENGIFDFLLDITDDDFDDAMNLTWYVYDLFDNNYSGFYKLGNDSDKNMSLNLGWHDAGDYRIDLVANDLLNHTTYFTWNVFVNNNNRPPNKPTITFPTQDHFYTYNNSDFNWTLVTDPDNEIGKTSYDVYDITYRLIIANTTGLIETMLNIDSNPDTTLNSSLNATVFFDKTFNDTTSEYVLNDLEELPSGFYKAILIANDSEDFNYSDIVSFEIDLPPEVEIYRIFRNPAKITFHNVTINWSAKDDNGIVESYINITAPNGTQIGKFPSDIKLNPINMTYNGTYQIVAFAKDSKNSTATVYRNFSVVYDIWPPNIILLNPKLHQIVPGINASVGGTGTLIFEYNVTDLSPVEYCALYLESKFVTQMIPWSVFGNRTDIYDGLYGYKGLDIEGTGELNRFVVPDLVRGTYKWNVQCMDNENNTGYAPYNGSFELDIPDSQINIIEPELTGEVSQNIPRYGVELDIPKTELNSDDIFTIVSSLRPTGDQLTSVEISTNVSWLILGDTYLPKLSSLYGLVMYVNTNNLDAKNYSVEFVVRSNEVSYVKKVTFIIKGSKSPIIELPGINRLSLLKRLEIEDDIIKVKLVFSNVGYGTINKFTIADSLANGHVEVYDPKQMELDKFNRLLIQVPTLNINSNYSVEYTVKDLNLEDISKPIFIGNEIYTLYEQEINVPLDIKIGIKQNVIREQLLSSALLLFVLLILGLKVYQKGKFSKI